MARDYGNGHRRKESNSMRCSVKSFLANQPHRMAEEFDISLPQRPDQMHQTLHPSLSDSGRTPPLVIYLPFEVVSNVYTSLATRWHLHVIAIFGHIAALHIHLTYSYRVRVPTLPYLRLLPRGTSSFFAFVTAGFPSTHLRLPSQ